MTTQSPPTEYGQRRNVPEMTVTDLALSLKRTLEESYSHVRVRGELSRVKIHTSGHMYSDLKDADSVINVVCWKGTVAKLSVRPEEGLEVICTGRISSYPGRSNYQLIIETMELAGQGALLKMLEDRRQKLAAEGLFDATRKKKIPYLPRVIGVVTSPTGAVIRDIMHRLNDRFPRDVLLWPVLVQGPGASEQITTAIRGFNALTPDSAIPRPDLLIVARGGGSLEDLMAFNEENVVRATAESQIPIISAVGHETDTTLIDFAADLRAPTPTGAAEMAVPMRADLITNLGAMQHRLQSALHRNITQAHEQVRQYAARLPTPSSLLDIKIQKCDLLSHRLETIFDRILSQRQSRVRELGAMLRHPQHLLLERQRAYSDRAALLTSSFKSALTRKESQLLQVSARLRHPAQLIDDKEQRLQALMPRLDAAYRRNIGETQRRLQAQVQMLESLSFENVLKRGYAVIRDENGNVITQAKTLKEGQMINIQLQDGKQSAKVGS
jgi:exodeoxyribonuclease VII large subunit